MSEFKILNKTKWLITYFDTFIYGSILANSIVLRNKDRLKRWFRLISERIVAIDLKVNNKRLKYLKKYDVDKYYKTIESYKYYFVFVLKKL